MPRSFNWKGMAPGRMPRHIPAAFDARFDTPLAKQNLLNAPPTGADLSIPGVKIIASGDPARSLIYLRMNRRRDVFNMPPLASNVRDRAALAVLEEWIKSLRRGP